MVVLESWLPYISISLGGRSRSNIQSAWSFEHSSLVKVKLKGENEFTNIAASTLANWRTVFALAIAR